MPSSYCLHSWPSERLLIGCVAGVVNKPRTLLVVTSMPSDC